MRIPAPAHDPCKRACTPHTHPARAHTAEARRCMQDSCEFISNTSRMATQKRPSPDLVTIRDSARHSRSVCDLRDLHATFVRPSCDLRATLCDLRATLCDLVRPCATSVRSLRDFVRPPTPHARTATTTNKLGMQNISPIM